MASYKGSCEGMGNVTPKGSRKSNVVQGGNFRPAPKPHHKPIVRPHSNIHATGSGRRND